MKYCQNQSRMEKHLPEFIQEDMHAGSVCWIEYSVTEPPLLQCTSAENRTVLCDTGGLVCCLSQDAPKAVFIQSILVTDECNVRDVILLLVGHFC